jgi:hypothetical protein
MSLQAIPPRATTGGYGEAKAHPALLIVVTTAMIVTVTLAFTFPFRVPIFRVIFLPLVVIPVP